MGKVDPYVLVQRGFLRQTIGLGGEQQALEPDLNQLSGLQTADRVVLTVGKYSVVDIFDTNKYAHDPRHDFLNWSIIDIGSFDYAANSWGYTYGGAVEWYQNWWALRTGMFDLSTVPNSNNLSPTLPSCNLSRRSRSGTSCGASRAISNFSIGFREAISAPISTRSRSARRSARRPQPRRAIPGCATALLKQ